MCVTENQPGKRLSLPWLSTRTVTALLSRMAVLIWGLSAFFSLPLPASAAPAWYDGLIQYSDITNCVSIIQGMPYTEKGVGAYVGFFADPDNASPSPNVPYSVRIVIAGLGNACAGQRAFVDLSLPPNTSLAISQTRPVRCFYNGNPMPANQCPQVLQQSPFNPGAFSILSPDAANVNTWPLPQGWIAEFQIPVVSSTALTNSTLQAHIRVFDGQGSPWLRPTRGVYVFAGTPNILYPSPSTISITATTARSQVNIYTFGIGGTGYFELGKTTSYELFQDPVTIPSGGNGFLAWDDWGPPPLAPDTEYNWRFRFVASNGQTYIGSNQTFRTLPDGRVTVGSGTKESCTEDAFTRALSTAKEIRFNCGSVPVEIPLTSTKRISSTIVIDGENKVTLDGGSARKHLQIDSPAQVTLKDIMLSKGKSATCGGSISVASGAKLVLSGARLIDNASTADGGAICNRGSLEAYSSLFKGNSSSSHGGAIQSSGQNFFVADSRFEANVATFNGGAIDMGQTVTISSSSFIGNSGFRGGAINSYLGTLNLSTSTFSQNTARLYGGAISSDDSTSTILTSTFSGNAATGSGSGGAIERGGTGTLTLRHSTLVGNSAAARGGNIMTATGGRDTSIIVRNSIVSSGVPQNCDFTVASQGTNIESSNSCGFNGPGDVSNTDPVLGPLQDNGGLTRTYLPLPGSPAIDAGSQCPIRDQRNRLRPADGDQNGSSICDIGAVERCPFQISLVADQGIAREVDGQKARFVVSRTGDVSSSVTVNYIVSGTATTDSDYSVSPGPLGTVTIPAGTASAIIDILPVNDSQPESDESVVLTLVEGSEAVPQAPASATITIVSDDAFDGSGSNGDPTIPSVNNAPSLAEALDSKLIWQTGGAGSWSGQSSVTKDGVDAARSSAIADKKNVWMRTVVVGPGKVTFWWRTSSEKGDKLNFFIGKTLRGSRSGETSWQKRTFKLAKGRNVLRWEFKRNAKGSGGLNAAFVDEVVVQK